jgi:hypothetical protein
MIPRLALRRGIKAGGDEKRRTCATGQVPLGSMPVTKEHAVNVTATDVIDAYRHFLGREPESQEVIAWHMRAPDLETLRRNFKDSMEFKAISAAGIPATVFNFPSMLSTDDKIVYYQTLRDLYTFSGAIVDLGAFMGATATAMLFGCFDNARWSADTVRRPLVHSFDLWKLNIGAAAYINHHYNEPRHQDGDDFLYAFQELVVSRFGDLVLATQGDVASAPYHGGPIEILSVDVCKSRSTTEAVFRRFMPLLMKGAYILQQDFVHPWHPYLHTAVGYFAERFEVVREMPEGSTVLYRLIEPIEVAEMQDFSRVTLLDKTQWLPLMDQAFAQLRTEQSRIALVPARALLIAEVEGLDAAEAYIARERRNVEFPPLVARWNDEVLMTARKDFG